MMLLNHWYTLVISKLDYCNVLLHGISDSLLTKLQHVQNTGARIVTRTSKSEHISPVLLNLHWLPVRSRIIYKVLLHVYKALNNMSPQYIRELLTVQSCQRSLRSKDTLYLTVPLTKTVTYGDRAFTSAVPKEWNSLPLDIRKAPTLAAFKRSLKTYLFRKTYEHLL